MGHFQAKYTNFIFNLKNTINITAIKINNFRDKKEIKIRP